ncbi:MAG: TetR/AcrR family transcriptional regulator C-terminal domain-containing protein [Erysipelotrichales bacterium]|nr:TetR/AcrR family transcriptional regulator C-terminal domain-containing protein [Erysipelotrichales bacterium]
MDKKIDRRIIKTKKAIRKAFAEMLRVKSFDFITVKDIADNADISRKTFYTYYQGVWAIKNEIEEEIINLIDKDLSNADAGNALNNPQLLFIRLNSIFSNYTDFFDAIIANSDNMYLVRGMAKVIIDRFKDSIKARAKELEIDESKLNLIIKYTITGIFFIYKDWYKNGRVEPIEDVCKDLGTLIFDGLNGFAKVHIG